MIFILTENEFSYDHDDEPRTRIIAAFKSKKDAKAKVSELKKRNKLIVKLLKKREADEELYISSLSDLDGRDIWERHQQEREKLEKKHQLPKDILCRNDSEVSFDYSITSTELL